MFNKKTLEYLTNRLYEAEEHIDELIAENDQLKNELQLAKDKESFLSGALAWWRKTYA